MATAEKELQPMNYSAMPILNVSNEQKLIAIRETVAKGANDAEFTMLMHLANTYKLDPFLKEIWFIKYGQTPTIMVSRDGLRNYAQRQDDFEGMISQEVRKGDEFSYNPITKEIHHVTGDGSGDITKAYAIVYRKDRQPHIEVVDFQEYFTALAPKNGVWKSHPSAMIRKTVEVLALKHCYTITGLYAPEEMGLQEPSDIPAPDMDIPYGEPTPHQKPHPLQQSNKSNSVTKEWLDALNSLNDLAAEQGLMKDELRNIGQRLLGKSDPKKWSMEDISTVRAYVEQFNAQDADEVQPEESTGTQSGFELPDDADLPF